MTSVSKAVLISSCVISFGIIGYVHYRQRYEREQLHLGVIRDMERQERNKRENLFVLQRQIELTKELKRDEANHKT